MHTPSFYNLSQTILNVLDAISGKFIGIFQSTGNVLKDRAQVLLSFDEGPINQGLSIQVEEIEDHETWAGIETLLGGLVARVRFQVAKW